MTGKPYLVRVSARVLYFDKRISKGKQGSGERATSVVNQPGNCYRNPTCFDGCRPKIPKRPGGSEGRYCFVCRDTHWQGLCPGSSPLSRQSLPLPSIQPRCHKGQANILPHGFITAKAKNHIRFGTDTIRERGDGTPHFGRIHVLGRKGQVNQQAACF